jgi:hypothetical protein
MALAHGENTVLLDYALLAALLTLVGLILLQGHAQGSGHRTHVPVVVPAGGNAKQVPGHDFRESPQWPSPYPRAIAAG